MASTLQTNASAYPTVAINAQTSTTYTFALTDANNTVVSFGSAYPTTVTIPPNSSVAFPVGTILNFAQTGAGQTTITQGSGVTITSTGAVATAPKTRVQYSACSAIQTSANKWLVIGDIA